MILSVGLDVAVTEPASCRGHNKKNKLLTDTHELSASYSCSFSQTRTPTLAASSLCERPRSSLKNFECKDEVLWSDAAIKAEKWLLKATHVFIKHFSC